MADITFTKPTWVNGTTPAINGTNLQAQSDALDAVCHKANRGSAVLVADQLGSQLAAAFWYSSSGTGGSDGNGGQPPAPKAVKWTGELASGIAQSFTLPASNGTWLVTATNDSSTNVARVAIIQYTYGGHSISNALADAGSGVTITLSGADVVITNTSGSSASMSASVIRLAW